MWWQASQLDIRWHCAMLDVLSALLRLCGSCQALALASLAPSGQLPAAQTVLPTGILITSELWRGSSNGRILPFFSSMQESFNTAMD